LAIYFHEEKPGIRLKEKRKLTNWLKDVILEEGKIPGVLNIILTSDRHLKEINKEDFNDYIITLRFFGTLSSGRQSDIPFNEIINLLYDKGAYFVMKNANKLVSKEFEEIKTSKSSVEEIEDTAIGEHAGQLGVFNAEREKEIAKELIRVMAYEKEDGEKTADFENRVRADVDALLEL